MSLRKNSKSKNKINLFIYVIFHRKHFYVKYMNDLKKEVYVFIARAIDVDRW